MKYINMAPNRGNIILCTISTLEPLKSKMM